MTEISAQTWVENDRTDVPHRFVFVKIIRNPEIQVQIIRHPKVRSLLKYTVGNFVKMWSEMGRRGSVWAEKWMEMKPTRSRIIFKPIVYIKHPDFCIKKSR